MARGILAELQRQVRIAERERVRRERDQERALINAAREQERSLGEAAREEKRTLKAQARAEKQEQRTSAAERKRLEKEAQEEYVATREAEAEEQNIEVQRRYEEIDGLLAVTLEVDDFVDLDSLKSVAEHPPFGRTDLQAPLPPPDRIPDPTEPVFDPPPAPTGLGGLFGKKKHAKAVDAATVAHDRAIADWKLALEKTEADRKAAAEKHERMISERAEQLAKARAKYDAECAAREAEAKERNKAIDDLKSNLAYGSADAVQEYVSIVLANSVYPDHFPVEHDFEFEPRSAELKLRVSMPSPDQMPTVRAYKYKKASDEIVEMSLSQKVCKDRYASAAHQIALRSLHEVFEADRRGIIGTIALQVGADTVDPATGLKGFIPFIAIGAERTSFMEFDLANVTPSATLALLGAAVSKNPYGLVAVDVSGIRKS